MSNVRGLRRVARAMIRSGIIELDVWGTGEMILFYAKEGADTSGFELMTMDEIRAAYEAADPD